jgi:hypothetical protein
VEPVNLVQQLSQNRDAIISQLAASRFALSKEEAEEFDTNPAGAISKMAGRVHYEAVNAALLHIQNFVPMIAASVMQRLSQAQEAERAFYDSNKALDRAKHGADVSQFFGAFRAANPKMTQADLASMVAAAVMAKYGLTAQPAIPTPPQPPRTPPFVPASPGGGAVRVEAQPDIWAGMGQDYDQ